MRQPWRSAYQAVTERAERHAEQAAARRQRRRLDDELAGDVATGRAERAPQADLRSPFEHRDHHHVGDADTADDERDGAQPEQQPPQALVDAGRVPRAHPTGATRRPRSVPSG